MKFLRCLNFPRTHLQRHKICWSGCCQFQWQWDNEGGAPLGVQTRETATMVPAWCLRAASQSMQWKPQFQCTQGHHRSKVSQLCLYFDWTVFGSTDTTYNAVLTLHFSPVSLLEMLGRLWRTRWSQLWCDLGGGVHVEENMEVVCWRSTQTNRCLWNWV